MMMRSIENTIYFASVNYALRYPESATSLIDPSGECQAYLPYGEEGVLVQEIDLAQATGLLAMRYAPERYARASPRPLSSSRSGDSTPARANAGRATSPGRASVSCVKSCPSMRCCARPCRKSLTAGDWEHNVHADYQTSYFRSLEYLRTRVAGEAGLNILAVVRNPSRGDVESVETPSASASRASICWTSAAT